MRESIFLNGELMGRGSCWKTSRAAPPRRPLFKAVMRASSQTRLALAVLIRKAPGFIRANSAVFKSWVAPWVWGIFRETKSDLCRRLEKLHSSTDGKRLFGRNGLQERTCISKAWAFFANDCPIDPSPTMPMVFSERLPPFGR